MAEIKGRSKPNDIDLYRRVGWLQQQYARYSRFWQADIDRYVENARMFGGLNFGQWPADVVQYLLNKNRRPPTFNFLLDKIETFVGSIMGSVYDIRYSPIDGSNDAMALKLQDMYISDKINMDWDISEMETILDSAVAVGYERMCISDKMHWLGNIAFEKLNPRHILLDPGWKSNDPYKLKSYFRFEKMSAEEMFDIFPNHTERLIELRNREMVDGIDHGENISSATYKTMDEKWGGRHTVIELHWTETEERYWEYDVKNNTPFPDCGYKVGSDEDRAIKIQYIQKAGLNPEDIVFMRQKNVVKYVQACCPTIDCEMLLINGRDKVQVGSVNLLPLGFKYEGQYIGLVDRQKDLQIDYNKAEMLIMDQQMTSAKGGKIFDKALTGGDDELERQIEAAWNTPGANVWAAAGSTAALGQHGGIMPMNTTPVSGDIFTQQQRRERNFDRFSKVPAAQESRSEYAGEPNKMFENKNATALLGQKYISRLIQSHKKHKAEWYARQAKTTYSGIERRFSGKSGSAPVSINKAVRSNTGRVEIKDDIRLLPELKVNLVPSKDSESIRAELRGDYGQILQAIAADPRNRLLAITLVGATLETTPLPDDKKEEFQKGCELLKRDAALEVAIGIKSKEEQLKQLNTKQQPAMPPSAAAAQAQAIPEAIASNAGLEQQQLSVPQNTQPQ